MAFKIYLKYPCGKLFEIRVPIAITDMDRPHFVLPGAENYLYYAKQKFEINNLKVIEQESNEVSIQPTPFISLTKKMRCIE